MEGIVVNAHPSGDADLVLKIITREQGKISVFARSARKMKRGKGSRVDLFDWGRFELGTARGTLAPLRNFVSISSFPGIREQLEKLSAAALVCESFDALLPEDGPAEELFFDSLRAALEGIEQSKDIRAALRIVHAGLAAALTLSGYLPAEDAGEPTRNNLVRLIGRVEQTSERALRSKQAMLDILRDL